MNYKVFSIKEFDKQFKVLVKKYPSLKGQLNLLADKLSISPAVGIALGHNCYKIKIPIKSKGRGKRGGARIITFIKISEETVYLISIYDKSEQSDIPSIELKRLIQQLK